MIDDSLKYQPIDLISASETYNREVDSMAVPFNDSSDCSCPETCFANNISSDFNFEFNGKVDNFMQGFVGDCGLLSSLKSMSYTEKGSQIISNAIIQNADGTFSVAFNGIGTEIAISSQELQDAIDSGIYSKGDNDVLLIELATQKAMDKIKNGEIETPDFLKNGFDNDVPSTTACTMDDIVYLLTGNRSEYQYNWNNINEDSFCANFQKGIFHGLATLMENSIEYVYNKLEKNPDDYCAIIMFQGSHSQAGEEITVQDVNSKQDVVLTIGDGVHAWSIKSVDGSNITLVNPWDSSIEYVVSQKSIRQYVLGVQYYKY